MNIFKFVFYRNTTYYLIHPIDFLKRIPRFIKYIHQRITRGWADCDTWNINNWIEDTLPKMLIYMAKHGISFPYGYKNREQWEKELIEAANFLMKSSDEAISYSERNESKNKFFDFIKEVYFNLWD